MNTDLWGVITAAGTAISAIVIATTVLLGYRQIGLTADQLEQLRRANQFEAAKTVLMEIGDPSFTAAFRFVVYDLPERLSDSAFRSEVAAVGLADEVRHLELTVLRALERVGTYVRYGLVDGEVIYDTIVRMRIVVSWERLVDVVAMHRAAIGGPYWENFEFAYRDCTRWAHTHDRDIDIPALISGMASARANSE